MIDEEEELAEVSPDLTKLLLEKNVGEVVLMVTPGPAVFVGKLESINWFNGDGTMDATLSDGYFMYLDLYDKPKFNFFEAKIPNVIKFTLYANKDKFKNDPDIKNVFSELTYPDGVHESDDM